MIDIDDDLSAVDHRGHSPCRSQKANPPITVDRRPSRTHRILVSGVMGEATQYEVGVISRLRGEADCAMEKDGCAWHERMNDT